jgi:uncharacterized protein YeaO (DUF488 family)
MSRRHAIHVKRAYDPPGARDGTRVLVDRLWPRGVRKEELQLDAWLKDIAPSKELRQWLHQDAARFDEFRLRYRAELDANPAAVAQLRQLVEAGPVTLLYGTRDIEHNHAQVLVDYLKG